MIKMIPAQLTFYEKAIPYFIFDCIIRHAPGECRPGKRTSFEKKMPGKNNQF